MARYLGHFGECPPYKHSDPAEFVQRINAAIESDTPLADLGTDVPADVDV